MALPSPLKAEPSLEIILIIAGHLKKSHLVIWFDLEALESGLDETWIKKLDPGKPERKVPYSVIESWNIFLRETSNIQKEENIRSFKS